MADTRRTFTDSGIRKLFTLKQKLTLLFDIEKLITIQQERENQAALRYQTDINTISTTTTATHTTLTTNTSASSQSSSSSHSTMNTDKYLTSLTSEDILFAGLDIVTMAIEHNQIDYFLEETNRKALYELVLKLDDTRGSYVPDVFNEQSYQVSLALKAFLAELDLKADVNQTAVSLLQKFIDITKTIDNVKNNVEFSCKFYEILLNIPYHKKIHSPFTKNIREQYEKWYALADSPDCDYQQLQAEYQQQCSAWISDLSSFPYVRIATDGKIVDQPVAFRFEKGNLPIIGMRGALLTLMIDCEKNLNTLLQKANLPLVIVVYDYLNGQYKEENFQSLRNDFHQLINTIGMVNEKYKKGDYKGSGLINFFKPIDPQKIKLFDDCIISINKILADKSKTTGEKVFSVAEVFFEAQITNKDIASSKNISVGELSKRFNEFIMQLITMRFDQIDQTNDEQMGKKLKFYREDLGLEQAAELSSAMKL